MTDADVMDKESLIDKYTRPGEPMPGAALGDDAEAEGYTAFSAVKGQRRLLRFRIVDARGVSYGVGYAYMVNWMFTPPDVLSIETTTHIFVIEGRGLAELEGMLMEEKLREVRAFNKLHHALPPETEPLVESIEVIERFPGNTKGGSA